MDKLKNILLSYKTYLIVQVTMLFILIFISYGFDLWYDVEDLSVLVQFIYNENEMIYHSEDLVNLLNDNTDVSSLLVAYNKLRPTLEFSLEDTDSIDIDIKDLYPRTLDTSNEWIQRWIKSCAYSDMVLLADDMEELDTAYKGLITYYNGLYYLRIWDMYKYSEQLRKASSIITILSTIYLFVFMGYLLKSKVVK